MAGWWATLIVGLAVLLLGRRLFWLFVGAVGFLAGLQWARPVLGDQPEWVIVVAALVLWLWDPVLIVLSALTGAVLLAPLIPVPPLARAWLFVGLLVVGMVVQARVLAPPARDTSPPPRRGA